MYACLHQSGEGDGGSGRLAELARCFSPSIEVTGARTVIFSIAGLGRLIGSPEQIASEICRRGAEMGLAGNLAIAANPNAAELAARALPGVTFIPVGREQAVLGKIPVARAPVSEELRETLVRWGLKTLGDVAELPPIGLAERLGQEGVWLYNLALGRIERPLSLEAPETIYEDSLEVEHAVDRLEPLLFLIARIVNELCRRLESQTRAANQITTILRIEEGRSYTRILELPVPQSDPKPLVKLIQLDLEAHPPPGAVNGVAVRFRPVRPRSTQGGLFVPPAPAPDKLELTLARIRGIVGEQNAGSPRLIETHRPDAFEMTPFRPPEGEREPVRKKGALRVALRFYRPPLEARVRTSERVPRHVRAPGVGGNVVEAAGPWRTSGEWWSEKRWARDEWDLELTDGGVYRVYLELRSRGWFVEGVYD